MAVSLDDLVKRAIELLPATGAIEFNAYKAKLYAAHPEGGQDAFRRMLTADLVNKSLEQDATGKPVVMLSKKAV